MPRAAALKQLRPSTPSPFAPAHRVALIGTPETVGQARDQLALAGAPDPLGCILVNQAQPRPPRAGGGLTVFGTLDDLDATITRQRISLAVVSLPLAMADTISQVRAILRRHGVEERFVPSLHDLLTQAPPLAIGLATPGAAAMGATPRIDIADLIGRTPQQVDRASIASILKGKRVLITGAGGSIGSELARIVCEFEPEEIQLVERAENPLFEIDRQIGRRFPGLARRAILHDVVDAEQTLRLLVDLKPHVVFHAAAHKHVPLMEDHPAHAITNNVFGTKAIADASLAVGVERFVMISSDKAVNPTSVMGATKRLAELYVQRLHDCQWGGPLARQQAGGLLHPKATRFSMVRFGNVLGSAGSVLTVWSAQLADGGPITITDPRMTRFFMTIPEAATLVIQAAAIDHDSPVPLTPALRGQCSVPPTVASSSCCSSAAVHVLDMGEPLSILDLAKRFVRAHGFEPRVIGWPEGASREEPSGSLPTGSLPKIDIAFTGIRPGEKLYEELSYSAEHLRETPFPGIRAWAGNPAPTNHAAMIADLSAVRTSHDRSAVLAAIRRHVPEMQ